MTGDVDTVSTNGGTGPWNLIGSTAGTRDDHDDPGGG